MSIEMLFAALILVNILYPSFSAALGSDDVINILMKRLDEQQRQIDTLQDVVKEQQLDILRLTHKHGPGDNVRIDPRPPNEQWFVDKTNDQNSPKPGPRRTSKRQLPVQGTVAFTAVLDHIVTNLGVNQNLVFNRVYTNVGDGYNEHHGVFTAPVSGIYAFYTSILTHPGNVAHCSIVVNGVSKADVLEQGSTVHSSGSQMIVIQLSKGDDVAVQSKNQADFIDSDSNIYSSFSGFLLQDLSGFNGGIPE